MKKTIKMITLVILSILFIYVLFITEESIRLLNNKLAEPLIMFNETYTGSNGDITYQSLGFKLKNIYACSTSKDLCYVTGQTFYLFDIFILWAWRLRPYGRGNLFS